MSEKRDVYLTEERQDWTLLILSQNDLPARELPLFDGQMVRALDDRSSQQTVVIVDLGEKQFIHPIQAFYLRCCADVLDWYVVPGWVAPEKTRAETWRGGYENYALGEIK